MSPEHAAAAALAGLPGVGPKRLRCLLEHYRPTEVLAMLATKTPPNAMVARVLGSALARMQVAAAQVCVDSVAERCSALGVEVVALGEDHYPAVLGVDHAAPALLFYRGDLTAFSQRRVAVIGTRAATAAGRATARELGEQLGEYGVGVVSGLARGIDGAAHSGACASSGTGRPIGVVGNGLDVPYPREHKQLWEAVANSGVLVSEWPPGVGPEPWRFPQRNRVLAAVSEIVVVVESRDRGGSLITVDQALSRGIHVMAVPGAPRQASSVGSNLLLRDGAGTVTSAEDVAAALGLHTIDRRSLTRQRPEGQAGRVLEVIEGGVAAFDEIMCESGLSIGDLARCVVDLEASGWVRESDGWYEAVNSRLVITSESASL